MKNLILLLALTCLLPIKLCAQDNNVELDVLRAPSSPASNLLSISTTDIDKPTDISSFMVSIQSASNSFTAFPSNYAIDFSPYYLFQKENTDFTTNGLQNTVFKNVFKQTFVISLAISNPDSTNTYYNYKSTYGGLGFKFSLFRGRYDSVTKKNIDKIEDLQSKVNKFSIKETKEYLKSNDKTYLDLLKKKENLLISLKGLNSTTDDYKSKLLMIITSKEYTDLTDEISEKLQNFQSSDRNNSIKYLEQTDEEYIQLQQQQSKLQKGSPEYIEIEGKLNNKIENFRALDEQKELFTQIKTIASVFQTQRIGFSWDVNGGVSGEFRNRNFANSKLFNAGIWTNLGYTIEKGFTILGLVRYLYNPDKILALDNNVNELEDISTLDAGARIVYSKSQSKFSCSIEGIYRSALSGDQIDPSWKMIFNADYALFKNQKLTFSFGRDFDGTVSKDGNLIAALTLIAGFGDKKISSK
jgi:hypothetical protein